MHYPPPVNGASFMGQCIRESNLINSTFETFYINLSTSNNLASIGKGGYKKLITTFQIIRTIIGRLKKSRVDLCYMTLTAQGPGFYKDMLIVCILKLFSSRIIYHFHNKGIAQSRENPINNLLYRFVLRNTKSILLSPRLLYDIKYYVTESNVFYCPNGIPVVTELTLRKAVEKPHTVCKILFVSNMLREKGFETVLEACMILKAKDIQFECHFIGDWVDISKEEFTKYIDDNDLKDLVFGHGPKYRSQKFEFFSHSDIFVFPTYYHNETFGLVNLEAMQFRLPIISTREGGIPDVVDDGISGFLIEPKNSSALANKLEILINDPKLRSAMGEAGHQRYLKKFTLEIFENRLTEILKIA
jgi:glycosyltransferase involved in cell wall biosynthesis